ncbi:UNVERIFIED_CONTAM: hypothetical protein Cloal_3304 [Acetivibrio alkalicellulosi]
MKKTLLLILVILPIVFITTYMLDLLPDRISRYVNPSRAQILYALGRIDSSEFYENTAPSETNHKRSVYPDIPLGEIMSSKGLLADDNINIYVDLSTRTLSFRYKDETLKQYSIGAGPRTDEGNKEREGDTKTPRGTFYICTKDIYSPPKHYLGSRWMLLSYPDISAAQRGLESGAITQDTYNSIVSANENREIPPQYTGLGSAIGIHGGAVPNFRKDWTAGCIGMYNQDVDEIFDFVKIGTTVVIE